MHRRITLGLSGPPAWEDDFRPVDASLCPWLPLRAPPSPLLSSDSSPSSFQGSSSLYPSILDLLTLPTLTLAISSIFMASTTLLLCKELLPALLSSRFKILFTRYISLDG